MNVQDLVIEVGLPVVSLAVWTAVYWLARLSNRPASVTAAPAAMEIPGQEPPAVVNLLANRWQVTVDAAESTLLDLAARGYVELRQADADPRHTTVHLTGRSPDDLHRYERLVHDRVTERAVDGVVPLTALSFSDAGRAAGWSKRMRRYVIADARQRGLSRRRFSKVMVTVLAVLGAVAAAGVTVGVWHYIRRIGDDQFGSFAAFVVTTGALIGIAGKDLGERDTPAGQAAAARWLGLRRWLAGHESFADLPPAAVAVWDRYLPYGAALGVTRVASQVIHLGLADRKRLWSSYGGGWRQVRVTYPSGQPRYGQPLGWIVFRAILAGMVGWTLSRVAGGQLISPTAGSYPDESSLWSRLSTIDPVELGVIASGLVLLGYAAYLGVRVLMDLVAPVDVNGEVLWHQVWQFRSSDSSSSIPVNHYLVVDDGRADQLRAWVLPEEIAGTCRVGDVVTARVRPWTRRVMRVTVHRPAPEIVEPFDDADDEDTLAGAVLPATADGARIHPERLLTAAEVGAALGTRVSLARPDATGQVRGVATFVDGRRATVLVVHVGRGGRMARIALLMGRSLGPALPGVGDEAYAGPDRVTGRRGDVVVLLNRPNGSPGDSGALTGLLATALSRLPAGTAAHQP
ncbi:DUF2207 domain-containing protein [Micromonospora sp. WMMD812]|uniref:DUF2207 family protein n=1 Tax=Micromonospora sp. WMMD812 TaxID=3015152 RepID=UPI00248C3C9C|nr:DUF2207 domain-containing protein [Micromonospora sp. WMMD812]WBB68432.1 DUF2207 domain-containing protein [Micromonospora sp. WMMD812]